MRHYVIVDQRDYQIFKSLANANTEILTVESLLPRWIRRFPLFSRAWLSLKTPPIRNWMLQQLVKLAFARSAPEAVTVFVDSDVVFVRPFDLTNFAQPNQTRLFRVPEFYSPDFEPLYEVAYRLLGLEGYRYGATRPDYIGNLISGRQANVVALCDRLEQVGGRPTVHIYSTAPTTPRPDRPNLLCNPTLDCPVCSPAQDQAKVSGNSAPVLDRHRDRGETFPSTAAIAPRLTAQIVYYKVRG